MNTYINIQQVCISAIVEEQLTCKQISFHALFFPQHDTNISLTTSPGGLFIHQICRCFSESRDGLLRSERGGRKRRRWRRGEAIPQHRGTHVMCNFVAPRTLWWWWGKELEWELKNRSYESKLLLSLVNTNVFYSCSPGPSVTLITDSYFLALIWTFSVIAVRGCEEIPNYALRACPYAGDWAAHDRACERKKSNLFLLWLVIRRRRHPRTVYVFSECLPDRDFLNQEISNQSEIWENW